MAESADRSSAEELHIAGLGEERRIAEVEVLRIQAAEAEVGHNRPAVADIDLAEAGDRIDLVERENRTDSAVVLRNPVGRRRVVDLEGVHRTTEGAGRHNLAAEEVADIQVGPRSLAEGDSSLEAARPIRPAVVAARYTVQAGVGPILLDWAAGRNLVDRIDSASAITSETVISVW